MNKNRLAHLTAVLGIALSQLQFVWLDPDADLPNKICTSIVTLLTLLFTDPVRHSTARTVTRTLAALALLVTTHLLTRGTFGTGATALLTTAAAVFARLRADLAAAPQIPAPVAGGPGKGTGEPGGGSGGPGEGIGGKVAGAAGPGPGTESSVP